jgi:HEAT repeat protein
VLRIAPTDSEAVDVLVEALRDSKPSIRREAALSLASLGSIVHAAAPALEKVLQDPNREIRF